MTSRRWTKNEPVGGLAVPVVSTHGDAIYVARPFDADELIRILNALETSESVRLEWLDSQLPEEFGLQILREIADLANRLDAPCCDDHAYENRRELRKRLRMFEDDSFTKLKPGKKGDET